jgi:hypothetical protein
MSVAICSSQSGVVVMKSPAVPTSSGAAAPDSQEQRQGRRRVVVGAGVAAGAALAVAALPGQRAPEAKAAADADPRRSETGYRLTEHIRRYYETTRT